MLFLLELVGALLVTRILYGAYKEYCQKHNISSLDLVAPFVKAALVLGGVIFLGMVGLTVYALFWKR